VPRVGLTFESEDAAYNFYNSYARRVGFSIRKCHVKHRASDGTLASKYMVCSNEGLKICNQTHLTKKERASTRSECKARIQFFISPEGIWRMQKVELAHNHPFVSPNKTHMLRSQRRMLPADEHIISKMREAGVKPVEIFEFFQLWSGGAENVQFLQMDCNNFIDRERKKHLESQDAKTLLEYLENKQVEDYNSCNSDPIICITTLPLLKTASESYTRNMYSTFQEEFQKQFTLSSTLINSEGDNQPVQGDDYG
jgi:hypothetical protein